MSENENENAAPPPPPAEPPAAAPPPPPPSEPPSQSEAPPPAAGDNRSVMIVLSYLWLLALVPLLVEKDDAEVQWHAKHGIVLMAAEILFWIAMTILSGILGAITAGLGCILSIFGPIFSLGFLVVHVLCIAKGLKGERFLITGVSQYADRF